VRGGAKIVAPLGWPCSQPVGLSDKQHQKEKSDSGRQYRANGKFSEFGEKSVHIAISMENGAFVRMHDSRNLRQSKQ